MSGHQARGLCLLLPSKAARMRSGADSPKGKAIPTRVHAVHCWHRVSQFHELFWLQLRRIRSLSDGTSRRFTFTSDCSRRRLGYCVGRRKGCADCAESWAEDLPQHSMPRKSGRKLSLPRNWALLEASSQQYSGHARLPKVLTCPMANCSKLHRNAETMSGSDCGRVSF